MKPPPPIPLLFYNFGVNITLSGLEWELRDMSKKRVPVKRLATPTTVPKGEE